MNAPASNVSCLERRTRGLFEQTSSFDIHLIEVLFLDSAEHRCRLPIDLETKLEIP